MSRRVTRRHRGGRNRKRGNEKSGGWGGKLFFVIVAGALVYAFFTVPISGSTAWQHAQRLVSSEVIKEGAKGKGPTELRKTDTAKTGANGAKPQDKPALQKGADRLTGKDQKELDDLIGEKLKK